MQELSQQVFGLSTNYDDESIKCLLMIGRVEESFQEFPLTLNDLDFAYFLYLLPCFWTILRLTHLNPVNINIY